MQTSYAPFIETEVPEDELIVSRTNLQGKITYANETFASISGYSADELIGSPHNIVRHPDMPRSVFQKMWETIQKEQMWTGYVKNLRKDGGFYWVYAEVSGVYKDGKLVEYKSLRAPVDESVKLEFQDRYDELREKEEDRCRIISQLSCEHVEKLKKFAKEKGVSEDRLLDEILEDYLL